VNPAFFGSWYPFPDNGGLDWGRYGAVDLLYISHLHRDHFDRENLAEHVSRNATVLLPDYPTDELREQLAALGFRTFRRLPNNQVVEHDGLSLMIAALTAPNDGAVGDSALAVDDGVARVLDQNDAKLTDFAPIHSFGPFDAHFLQFSGANWWPWAYELPERAQRAFGAEKRANGLARAQRFVETVKARHVIPSAGPACFLDEDLMAYNDLHHDEWNTFPDQTVFLERLRAAGLDGIFTVPGTVLEITGGRCTVEHPAPAAEIRRPFADKAAYLREYARARRGEIDAERASWGVPGIDILAELRSWFEPLMGIGDRICAGIGGPVLLRVAETGGDVAEEVVLDFTDRRVRRPGGERCRYTFTIARGLLERLIAEREVDWVNSLFLSLRFSASRVGKYNEFVYAFFTCLSPARMRYANDWYAAEQDRLEEDIRIGDWWVPRRCPHRHADLAEMGTLDGDTLTCQMHGWRFDLPSGRCLTSPDHDLRARRS
jgi:UDP-MurNAc hydroxylase